ncbi:TetR/AcrR family transcriptional regulator [Rhodococcus artemisiae]|uniref:TetR/AcrR family transcriptional regulator n=1 Tax=Rhodococcus artemisiae TaxID=714159 RepID=A0ABU7LC54_9NOCA|nr:TetR/AcrR family transcriptional regulator [Rhodococcus artemisiae]MEE2059135.1 TetR/AcrR family transcriptional regulator [Rhodococcus artemisiae]
MQESELVRRSGYGVDSLGTRGTRTRDQILAEALAQFAARGFHQTSVHDIAAGVGISRAALYQYFGSKDALFIELLDECGAAVAALVRRFEPPTPTARGFRMLRDWLDDWASVYDKYPTMFIEWSNINTPDDAVARSVGAYVTKLNSRLGAVLARAGVVGVDPVHASIVVTNVILRYNYLRHQPGAAALSDEHSYYLAVLLLQFLFPDAPGTATRPRPGEPPEWADQRVSGRPPARRRSAAPYCARFDGLSARAAGTVRELMKSGLRVFAEKGYHRASVDEIVADADLTRGTFYKYFDEKRDLLVALSEECSQDLAADARRFGRIDPAEDSGGRLRRWVRESFVVYGQYRGIYRTWIDRSHMSPEINEMRSMVVDAMRRALQLTLSRVTRSHALDLRVSHLFLVALIEEVPLGFKLNGLPVRQAPQTELLAVIIERSLFNRI